MKVKVPARLVFTLEEELRTVEAEPPFTSTMGNKMRWLTAWTQQLM